MGPISFGRPKVHIVKTAFQKYTFDIHISKIKNINKN